MDSYGQLGQTVNGRFKPLYYVGIVLPGLPVEQNVAIGSTTSIAGVGLRDEPFRFRVPPVPHGRYTVQFSYWAVQDINNRTPHFELCAPLTVT